MSHRSFAAAAAILLATTSGCNFVQGGGGESSGGATAARSDVSPEALQAAVKDEAVRKFYEARQWQSAWTDEGAEQLKETLRASLSHGLDPQLYLADVERAQSPVEREVALSRGAIAYANALAHGRTDPKQLFEVYTLPRNQVDVPAGLAQAVQGGNASQWIESLAPQDEEYRALSQAYAQAMQAGQPQAPQPGQAPGAGAPQGINMAAVTQNASQGNAMQNVSQSNAMQSNQQAGSPAEGNPKQGAAKAGDAKQQQQQQADGGLRDKAVQLAVNLERRRWLPRQEEPNRIDVNTAASFLRYVRDGAQVDQRRVVVGEPGWETPQLGSPIYRLVANPDWTVPKSIAEQENLAGLSQAALKRRNFKMEDGYFVQQPGPESALGLVKFDMQNEHAIYLHDTPAKSLFKQDQRHRSHGCVRVEDAVGFARKLAENHGKLQEFNKALPTRETSFVKFDQNIPVRLLYHTAFLDNGQVALHSDAYGWDAVVAEALGLQPTAESRKNRQEALKARQERQSSGGGDYGP